MAVTVSGMFGNGKTYFAGSPVVIDISGLEWSRPGEPVTSPFTIVRIEVRYQGSTVGDFRADTGRQTTASFDISSALRAIWGIFEFDKEVGAAAAAAAANSAGSFTPSGEGYTNGTRHYRPYSLIVYTEYLAGDGVYTVTDSGEISGGQCALGWLTEWERSIVGHKEDADISYREHSNLRNGDASTKPSGTPERVGKDSITSWVDVKMEGTKCVYYSSKSQAGQDGTSAHAPIVLRDSQPYVDFLFVNRRGAVETCSGQTLEAMGIEVNATQYSRIERPSFKPSRSLMSVSGGGRREWQMSSGYVTREWAEWWVLEFLMARQWWMLYQGPGQQEASYVPVVVRPAKQQTGIYDRTKQQMSHVDFTVTLALEG